MYGDDYQKSSLHGLEKELVPIIKYGFSANYLISERLLKNRIRMVISVGSRGSVGSSVVATFLGISEVNPLPAHYICVNSECKHSEWFLDGSVPSGFDLPDKDCPNCGGNLKGKARIFRSRRSLDLKG